MIVCFTVDLEPDCPPYLSGWRGLEEGTPRLLALLDRERVPATFFCTGESAERFPQRLAAIAAAGHEVGSHGQTHSAFAAMSPTQARQEIRDSAQALRRFGPVVSFRAPFLRFPPAYRNLLADEGFRLDSSDARYKLDWYRTRNLPSALLRVPASVTSSVLRLPAAVRDPWLLGLSSPVVLFVHPWEFVDLRRERLRLDCRFRTGAEAERTVASALRLLRRHGATFRRMRELLVEPGA
ncbi:MAG: polysaccharide deacetylase family protein [Myxococcales bacterium]